MKTAIKKSDSLQGKHDTGSVLLNSYSTEELNVLAKDILASSTLPSQNVKDFLLEVRTW